MDIKSNQSTISIRSLATLIQVALCANTVCEIGNFRLEIDRNNYGAHICEWKFVTNFNMKLYCQYLNSIKTR